MAHVTPSSGNVFKDLGLPDAERLLQITDLRFAVDKAITEWTTMETDPYILGQINAMQTILNSIHVR